MEESIPALLAVLLLMAFVLSWLSGADWGHPFGFHSDELRYLVGVVDNPAVPFWTIYGRWPIYFQRLAAWASGRSTTDLILARRLSTLVTATGVVAAALTARELESWLGSLFTVAFLCGASAVVQSAHFFITDVWLWSSLAWTVYLACRLARRSSWTGALALGVAWGIGCGSKLSGLFFLPAVWAACAMARSGRRLWLFTLCTSVCGTVVLVGQPTLLVHGIEAYLVTGALLHHLGVASGYHLPSYALQFENTAAWTYYVTNLLWWGAGPALTITGLVATLGSLFEFVCSQRREGRTRHLRQLLIPVLALLSYYLASAGQRDKFARYVLPLLPILAVLAARMLSLGVRHLEPRLLRLTLSALIVAFGAMPGVAYGAIYGRPDTRLQAAEWIGDNVTTESSVCHEPDIGFAVPPVGLGGPAFGSTATRQYVGTLLDWGLLYSCSDYLVRNQRAPVNRSAECDELSTQAQQRARIQTWLSSCDWLVLSDRFADQYLPLSVEFEAISAFYSDLLNCRDGGWEQVAEFWSWPQLFGVSVDDRGSELTFRSFDHPTIWVFRRRIP